MEQRILPDFGGRRSGLDRRMASASRPLKKEKRSGYERRNDFERRLQARFTSGTLKNLGTIKFDNPATFGKTKK